MNTTTTALPCIVGCDRAHIAYQVIDPDAGHGECHAYTPIGWTGQVGDTRDTRATSIGLVRSVQLDDGPSSYVTIGHDRMGEDNLCFEPEQAAALGALLVRAAQLAAESVDADTAVHAAWVEAAKSAGGAA